MIGSLKKLEILSFYHSSFGDYFPIELANLSNLRSFDLRFKESSCPLRPGVLSGMKKLEELYLGGSIPIEGEDQRYIIEELNSLTSLHTFQISTLNPILMQILKARCLENLENFQILGTTTPLRGTGNQYFTRSLSLRDGIEASMLLQPVIKSLMKRTYHLHIKEAKILKNVVIKMSSCNAIKSLFPESVANRLVNLQSLFILKCVMLEEVVSTDARENEVTKTCKKLEFPKLEKVRLVNLSRFKSFTSQSNSGVVHQTLFNQVNFPNMDLLRVDGFDCIVKLLGKEMPITSLHKLTGMRVLDCSKLLTIAESDSIQLLQNLERLRVRGCNALEVLFDFEGINITNDDAEINMLGRLTSLWLRSLPKLVHITRMVPKKIRVFQNLKNLDVCACENLRYLFSSSMANSLVALDFLKVSNCESIEEIIGKEEEGTSEIKIVEGMKTIIVFPNMRRLQLEDLSSIQMFCSQNYELVFPSLEDLTIEQCPEMKKLSPRPPSAPKLSKHTREHYQFFDISNLLDESGGSPKEEPISNK
ncbi:unnamed protein product [Fraxinus pennsylvanica]|uniref:Disease resistance protein At4g27190-like leucine-rich repeats domain-containing protein n=1 Tax=Fraxinus pennsylvanica TaxID=56036 RepID=A0AAD2DU06_9LAMI|nr:unnamed protein product [Fraxinus pennsylvanica]